MTLYCQSYQVDKGKLETLLQAYFYTLPACDSTVNALNITLEKFNITFNEQSKIIELRTQQRDLKVIEANLWQKRFENAANIHQMELKQAKKKGRKQGVILTGMPAILLIILIL